MTAQSGPLERAEQTPVTPFPVRLTSFVGRVAELRDIGRELRRHRLLSLVGPGGSGKTRLALEAARAWTGGQRWFVDLAPVDGDGVDAALAVATEAPEGPGEGPLDATVRRIGSAQALLVLDNCDQVVESSARAVDVLLRACPGLTALATSRAPLQVEGEHVWRVPPLSLPDTERALDGDAVLLFLDRAGLSPGTATRDLGHIHQICTHLDGMPLAIELAASRATVLPVSDIVTGLTDRFHLLTGGPRTVDTRQQSLAESIDWSYRLLTGDERTVLQRLAVFRAPFTAEAARAVAAGGSIADPDVLPLLANLVEKSFLVIDERHDVSRYQLLETIREYAVALLEAQPDEAVGTKDRHLRHLCETAEYIEPVFSGPAILNWVEHLEAELADVRSAVAWAAQVGNADHALRLVGAIGWFWWVRGRGDDRSLIETALSISGGEPRHRAKALTSATIAAYGGFSPDAVVLGQEAVRVATTCGDPEVASWAHCWLALTYAYLDFPHAKPYVMRACELARKSEDRRHLAIALLALTVTEFGDLPAAWTLGQEALALAVRNGDLITACLANYHLAAIGMLQGRLAEAGAAAVESLRTARMLRDTFDMAWSFQFLAWHAVLSGHEDIAAEHARATEATARASGNSLLLGVASFAIGICAHARGDLTSARRALAEAIPAVSPFIGGTVAAQTAALLADADLLAGDIAAARAHVLQQAALAEQAGIDWGRSLGALVQTRLALHDGEIRAATEAAHRALKLARRNEDAITTVDALELLARIAAQRRTPKLAVHMLGAAAAERARIGYARVRVRATTHDTLVHDIQRALGQEEFAKVWAEGERLPIADAVALARSGSRGRTARGWDALTPAELRVVALVGEGLNNVQIAERLFVTRDTVKGHVSAAFRKLGVANRTELAAEVARRSDDRRR